MLDFGYLSDLRLSVFQLGRPEARTSAGFSWLELEGGLALKCIAFDSILPLLGPLSCGKVIFIEK